MNESDQPAVHGMEWWGLKGAHLVIREWEMYLDWGEGGAHVLYVCDICSVSMWNYINVGLISTIGGHRQAIKVREDQITIASSYLYG